MSAGNARHKRAKSHAWEYRVIFLAAYPLFLVCEVIERILHLGQRTPARQSCKSIFAAAKEAADTSLPYAFRG
ncbi:MAG: hypothetical protein HC869_26055 [Rhodospirillales bacterium]|nr:hypothetical protein [Rhodospirillales bacterium]